MILSLDPGTRKELILAVWAMHQSILESNAGDVGRGFVELRRDFLRKTGVRTYGE